MRRTNRRYLVSWGILLTMLGEREELFHAAGMTFMTLEMRDNCVSAELPLLVLWGGRENLGISFTLKILA